MVGRIISFDDLPGCLVSPPLPHQIPLDRPRKSSLRRSENLEIVLESSRLLIGRLFVGIDEIVEGDGDVGEGPYRKVEVLAGDDILENGNEVLGDQSALAVMELIGVEKGEFAVKQVREPFRSPEIAEGEVFQLFEDLDVGGGGHSGG